MSITNTNKTQNTLNLGVVYNLFIYQTSGRLRNYMHPEYKNVCVEKN